MCKAVEDEHSCHLYCILVASQYLPIWASLLWTQIFNFLPHLQVRSEEMVVHTEQIKARFSHPSPATNESGRTNLGFVAPKYPESNVCPYKPFQWLKTMVDTLLWDPSVLEITLASLRSGFSLILLYQLASVNSIRLPCLFRGWEVAFCEWQPPPMTNVEKRNRKRPISTAIWLWFIQ